MSDVGQKIEQAKIIMNENVAGNVYGAQNETYIED